MNRAMIVSSPGETAASAENLLHNLGFTRVTLISSASQARRLIKSDSSPELVLINTPLPDEFGLELAETAAEEAAVILLAAAGTQVPPEVIMVQKPVDMRLLSDAVSLAAEEGSSLTREDSYLLSRTDEIRLINRAKSVLMKYLKFTEPQAHRYIEKQAMNNRQTRREAAQKIIDTYEK
ncbi:MAG: ANTAR domain-containing protein [Ruminococcus sp.]|nr:ANTAR domain-containing protein [Ruminococcus sp.]